MGGKDPKLEKKLIAAASDWKRAVVFTEEKVLASNWEVQISDLKPFCTAFRDRDATIAAGFDLQADHFDVNRWHDDYSPMLANGRRGDALSGEGIALAKMGTTFVLVTFTYPVVSALAMSQLRDFCRAEFSS
uniref:Profilin n=1 Tax=Rhodosorus marinus TaxID=101924 RepID=A0A7S0G5H2_9RHOD|mmetsp:Transcript_8421/g.12417  ORF Transcript_8421/g.12417 Transcript_8421/m.12417 type:complete len:132 (+) Transcript_8421:426-821(+)